MINEERTVEAAIVDAFERVACRKGLYIRAEEADRVRGFAIVIAEDVLGRGGAGRAEKDGRRYTSRDRDANVDKAIRLAYRVAERTVQRAREGKAETIDVVFRIGAQRMFYRTSSRLFSSLCPPSLPPIC